MRRARVETGTSTAARRAELDPLSELQAWLVEQLRKRTALPAQGEVVEAAARHLTGNDRLSPVEQLEIYREQFWLRHTSSLVEDFPGVSGILGQAEWQTLVESYLESHHPEDWTLRELGKDLPAHVARCQRLPHRELCHDMARLEWAFIELFDAREVPPLSLERVGSLPPGSLENGTIVLSPAVRLLEVSYPVADLRRALIRRRGSPQAPDVPVPEPEPQSLVLYRGRDRTLYHRPLRPGAFALLHALAQGQPLVKACQVAIEREPDGAERLRDSVGAWFRNWAERGWLVDVVPHA